VGGLALAMSSSAVAKGPPEDRGRNTAPGLNRDLLPDNSGAGLGRTVVLSGLQSGVADSFLRFSNLGQSAGTAQVTLFDAESGDEVATWESAPIPGHGALQVSLDDIAGDAEIDTDTSYVAIVRGAFKGQVQHVSWRSEDGVVSNMTACRRLETPNKGLGYVAGPGAADLDGVLRIANEGTKKRSVELVLHSAATGEALGTWTSPEIAGHGAFEISIADVSAAAVAPVPAETAALTVSLEGSGAQMTLGYAEGIEGGAVTDLTAGCAIRGGGMDADEDDDGDDEEDEDDIES
jgi:hypothetical protein